MQVKRNLEGLEWIAARLRMHVVDRASPKPIDPELIPERADTAGSIVAAESHIVIGGSGFAVAKILAESGAAPGSPGSGRVGVRERSCAGGTTPRLLVRLGLDALAIAEVDREAMKLKKA